MQSHLGMLVLAKKLGIEMTHIPYKTTAQSIMDVASGVIQLQLATVSPTLPLYQAGKIRILGVASDRRTPLLPDVPTLQEEGVPDLRHQDAVIAWERGCTVLGDGRLRPRWSRRVVPE